jgi:hypothetical protein
MKALVTLLSLLLATAHGVPPAPSTPEPKKNAFSGWGTSLDKKARSTNDLRKDGTAPANTLLDKATAADPRQIVARVIRTSGKRMIVSTRTPIAVRDGSNRTLDAGSTIVLDFPSAAPVFPDGTTIKVKIDPVGRLTKYSVNSGAMASTGYAFAPLDAPREQQ